METQWDEPLTLSTGYSNIVGRYVKDLANRGMITGSVEKGVSPSVFRRFVGVFKREVLLFNHSVM